MAFFTYPPNEATSPSFTNASVSGVLSLAAGTLAAPALSFTVEAGLGLYRSGSNTLSIASNNVNVAFFQPTIVQTQVPTYLDASIYCEDAAAFPSATYDTAGLILRTASGGSAPFDQAGSMIFRSRVSSTAGRSTIYFYTGSPATQALRINETQQVIMSGAMASNRADVASAATITALSSAKSFVKLTGSTITSLQGITAGVDGQRLTLVNLTGANLTVANENAGATAANRITTMTGADVVTTANGAAEFIYDTGSSRWICLYVTA